MSGDPEAIRARIRDLGRRCEALSDAGSEGGAQRLEAEVERLTAEARRDHHDVELRMYLTAKALVADGALEAAYASNGLAGEHRLPQFPLLRLSEWLRAAERRLDPSEVDERARAASLAEKSSTVSV